MRTTVGASQLRRNVGVLIRAVWQAAVLLGALAAGVQEGNDGEDASVVVWPCRQVELRHHALDVLLDRAFADPEMMRDSHVRSPLSHQSEDVAFSACELREWVMPS